MVTSGKVSGKLKEALFGCVRLPMSAADLVGTSREGCVGSAAVSGEGHRRQGETREREASPFSILFSYYSRDGREEPL